MSGSRPVSNELAVTNDKSIVRIRDPVTSKVKTMYITDPQLEDLSKRHEQDKTKVNSFITNNIKKAVNLNTAANNMLIIKKQKTPVDLGHSKIMEEYDAQQASTAHFEEEDDDNFQQLMKRHHEEKLKVNEFEAAPNPASILNQADDDISEEQAHELDNQEEETDNN